MTRGSRVNSLRAVTIQLGYCGALLNARVVELHIQVMALLLCTCLVLPGRAETGATAAESTAPSAIVPASRSALVAKFGKLPLSFEKNEGQADSRVKYLARGQGYDLFFTQKAAAFALHNPACNPAVTSKHSVAAGSSCPDRGNLIEFELEGANPNLQVLGDDLLPGKSNYFIGNDPGKWRTNVPNYARVKYQSAYPGIDVVYYGNQRQLEFDLVVAPGADLHDVHLNLRGATKLELDTAGNLLVHALDGNLRLLKPVIYQASTEGKTSIDGRYVLRPDHQVAFETDAYDRTRPLIVDPTLVYSTYLGGNGTDQGKAIAVDASGNAYIAGNTTSATFPTDNPIETAGSIFVTKLNSSGTALVYSTYFGGNITGSAIVSTSCGQGQCLTGLKVDSSGEVFITGIAFAGFPTVNQIAGACSTHCQSVGGFFVAKLNAAGSAIDYASMIGGGLSSALAVDSTGNAYVVGETYIAGDFPVVNAYQSTFGGGSNDAFLVKVNSTGTALDYSTFLGGTGSDQATGVAVDSSGSAYVAGTTFTLTGPSTFPTANQISAACVGTCATGSNQQDAFIAKFKADGSALVYSSLIGGSGNSQAGVGSPYYEGASLAIDPLGGAYVAGITSASNFPTTAGAYETSLSTENNFVVAINPAGSAMNYSTFLGGTINGTISPGSSISDIAVDSSGDVVVVGGLGKTLQLVSPLYPSYFISEPSIAILDPTGSKLLFSSSLADTTGSGSAQDSAFGVTFDATGNVYVTGGGCGAFPSTTGVFQPSCASSLFNAFVAKVSFTPSAPTVSFSPSSLTFASQNVGSSSSAQQITLTNSDAELSISGITIGGSNASDYTQTNTCGSGLAAGAICTIDVTFTPSAAGTRTASVSIADNATGSPQTVSLSGTGTTVSPVVSLAPTNITFSSQTVGTTSSGQNITLTNTGTAALSVTGVSISGTNSGDFSQTNTCGSSVAAGAFCTISVTFTPSASGTRTASISIADNASGSPQTVSLTGTGATAAPAVTLSPTSLTFSSQNVGSSSAAQMITLTNSGTASLNITGITITGTNAGDYSETTTCGSSVAVNANCTISVIFKPTAAGARTASVSIADNATGSPQSVALTGTAVTTAPSVTLAPTSLTFASQTVGTSSTAQNITLTNGGNAALNLTGISIAGTDAGDFVETNTCASSVAAGANCTISVTFKPTASGARTASVSIADNAGNSPQSVALTGAAVVAAPAVTLSPTSLTFASQNIGSASSAQTVTLTNSGTASLSITSVAITGTNAGDYSETNTCGSSVAAGANCAISVIFNPTAAGTRTGSISIADNAIGSPQTVPLSGTGASPPPDFSITANPTTITVTAGKSGTSTLTITPLNGFNQQVSFACTGLPSKAACSFSPSNITPNGAAATTTVTLSTDGSSSATAMKAVPSAPASIALAGLFASFFSLVIVRKRAVRLFPVLLVIFVLGVLAGCGGSSHDTTKGSYTITVTASSGSGASALSHTTNISLTVQ